MHAAALLILLVCLGAFSLAPVVVRPSEGSKNGDSDPFNRCPKRRPCSALLDMLHLSASSHSIAFVSIVPVGLIAAWRQTAGFSAGLPLLLIGALM